MSYENEMRRLLEREKKLKDELKQRQDMDKARERIKGIQDGLMHPILRWILRR